MAALGTLLVILALSIVVAWVVSEIILAFTD